MAKVCPSLTSRFVDMRRVRKGRNFTSPSWWLWTFSGEVSKSETSGATSMAILPSSTPVGVKAEHHPEFLVVDGDGGGAAHAALGRRDGIFTAGQERGLWAAGGHQVGLREHPAQILLLEEVEEHGPQGPGLGKASPWP